MSVIFNHPFVRSALGVLAQFMFGVALSFIILISWALVGMTVTWFRNMWARHEIRRDERRARRDARRAERTAKAEADRAAQLATEVNAKVVEVSQREGAPVLSEPAQAVVENPTVPCPVVEGMGPDPKVEVELAALREQIAADSWKRKVLHPDGLVPA